ncbi:MAG: hypothetical protein PHT51_03895 [Patescibacteria group bacterium]|nr:hypothetical protein [Patescibacteria group bacterium]MDD4610408.1 hypothetical protein [Patescibacteria group bacterium]
MKGKFIVIYGINNLGKTTQAKLLVENLNNQNIKTEYIKYPIYSMEPAGKLINSYLREGNPDNFSPRELQLLHYIDRITFEPILKEKLSQGINIVAEDYFGTGMAWGMSAGVDEKFLSYLYKFLYKEDLAILLDGERFKNAVEKNHKHEEDDKLTKKSREIHLYLAKKYKWKVVNANQNIKKVQSDVWNKIKLLI